MFSCFTRNLIDIITRVIYVGISQWATTQSTPAGTWPDGERVTCHQDSGRDNGGGINKGTLLVTIFETFYNNFNLNVLNIN